MMGKKCRCPKCKEIIEMEDLEMVEDTRVNQGGTAEQSSGAPSGGATSLAGGMTQTPK